jgi:hypothetical protein
MVPTQPTKLPEILMQTQIAFVTRRSFMLVPHLHSARLDAPCFEKFADIYSVSSSIHRLPLGVTGANHVMLGTGDATGSATIMARR